MNSNKGITLIALVVSILVMLILAGVSINGVLNADTIGRAKEVAFKSEAKDIKDAWEAKIIGMDSTYLDFDDLSKVLEGTNASPDILSKLEIQNGRIVYKEDLCTPEEIEWLESIGIFGGLSIVASVKTNVRVIEEDVKTEKQQGMDVVIVLDTSGSMENNSRDQKMTNVINTTMKKIFEANKENRVGIVRFSGEYDYQPTHASEFLPLDHYKSIKNDGSFLSFDGNSSYHYIRTYSSRKEGWGWNAKEIIEYNIENSNKTKPKESMIISGGTYTQAGLWKAYDVLSNEGNKENLPAIILVTDGLPTYYSTEKDMSSKIKDPSGNGSSTTWQHGYYNVETAINIKNRMEGMRIYNIAIANFQGADKAFIDLMLNPCEETLQAAKNVNRKGDNISLSNLSTFVSNFEKNFKSDYQYANGYKVGELSEAELSEWFQSVVEDIKNNLNSEITIGTNNNITGVYQVNADNLTYTGVGTDGKKGTWTFKLAENNNITLRVTAASFLPTESGEGQKVEGSDVTKKYDISIQDIKDGKDANLYYSNGQIKWNVRSEYKNSEGIAKQALSAVEVHEGCEAQITEVVIELPVLVDTFVEDTSN